METSMELEAGMGEKLDLGYGSLGGDLLGRGLTPELGC